MSDHLDDLLSGLGDGPVPPLAPADLVRRRGAQRRRRVSTALGAGAAVVVLAVGGIALAATGSGRTSGITYDGTPAPSTTQTTGLTGEAVVGARDVAAIAHGTRTWSGSSQSDPVPLLVVCPGHDAPAAAGTVHISTDGQSTVTSQVLQGATSGQTLLDGVLEDVGDCAHQQDEATTTDWDSTQYPGWWTVTRVTKPCPDCPQESSVWVVVAAGRFVSFLELPTTEADHTDEFMERMRSRMLEAGAYPAGHPVPVDPATGITEAWGVHLAVGTSEGEQDLKDAQQSASELGYSAPIVALDCESGTRDALHLDSAKSYWTSTVYFATQSDAQEFVDLYQPGVAGTAHITFYCND